MAANAYFSTRSRPLPARKSDLQSTVGNGSPWCAGWTPPKKSPAEKRPLKHAVSEGESCAHLPFAINSIASSACQIIAGARFGLKPRSGRRWEAQAEQAIKKTGAHGGNRTRDLSLTKAVALPLSHMGGY